MCARSLLRRWADDRSASSAIEFAILGPAFLAMLFGIFVFGWAINMISSVNLGVERAGRELQLRPAMTAQDLQTVIASQFSYLDPANLQVSLAVGSSTGGYRIGKITASYSFAIELPLAGSYPIAYSANIEVPLLTSS